MNIVSINLTEYQVKKKYGVERFYGEMNPVQFTKTIENDIRKSKYQHIFTHAQFEVNV